MVFKDILKSKKFYIIAAILLTVAIIKVLAIFIYTKDEPKVVPEKAREEVRGGLKEAAEAIAVVTPRLSETLVEAAYTPPTTNSVDTSDWQTYVDEEHAFSFSYPEDMVISKNLVGDIFIVDSEDLEKLEKKRDSQLETDNLYWGGRGISIEQIQKSGELLTFINNQLGDVGITIKDVNINGLRGYAVTDRSQDRFGGGVGYFYFLEKEDEWYVVSLDYFYGQEESNYLNEVFNRIAESFKN